MSTTKRDWEAQIDPKFYRGHTQPTAKTVQELRELLKELPDDLPIEQGFAKAVELVVYNIADDCHLEFREPEDDFDDEE